MEHNHQGDTISTKNKSKIETMYRNTKNIIDERESEVVKLEKFYEIPRPERMNDLLNPYWGSRANRDMAFKLERKRLEELDDYTEVSEETDTVPNSMSITRLNMIDRYINEDSTLKSVLNGKEMKHFIEHERI